MRLAVAVGLTALLVIVPVAGAKSGLPWIGTYDVAIISGSQTTDWSINHTSAGMCDPNETGSGTEDETFEPGASKQVQVTGAGAVGFVPEVDGLGLNVLYDREGTITDTAPPGSDSSDCPSGGGDTTPTPDCGARRSTT